MFDSNQLKPLAVFFLVIGSLWILLFAVPFLLMGAVIGGPGGGQMLLQFAAPAALIVGSILILKEQQLPLAGVLYGATGLMIAALILLQRYQR